MICTDPASDPNACTDCLEADRCPNLEPIEPFDFAYSDRPYPVMYQSIMPVLTAAAARYDMAHAGIVR
jgi:hypothetical protein